MKKILFDSTEPSEWEELKKEGFIINAHFLRPVRLSLDFYNEIETYDLSEIFSKPKDIFNNSNFSISNLSIRFFYKLLRIFV